MNFCASSLIEKPFDCFRLSMAARTLEASRPLASNKSRSKLEEIWISIDGDVVALTSRIS